MIALDTNLLVYAHRAGVPEHRRAQDAIERARGDARGWGIAAGSVSEFWSVVTHARSSGRPSMPSEARAFFDALTEGGMRIWLAKAGFGERLMKLAQDLEVTGVRIFDLQIALTVLESGARELWTHDANFVQVPGVRFHDPLFSEHEVTKSRVGRGPTGS